MRGGIPLVARAESIENRNRHLPGSRTEAASAVDHIAVIQASLAALALDIDDFLMIGEVALIALLALVAINAGVFAQIRRRDAEPLGDCGFTRLAARASRLGRARRRGAHRRSGPPWSIVHLSCLRLEFAAFERLIALEFRHRVIEGSEIRRRPLCHAVGNGGLMRADRVIVIGFVVVEAGMGVGPALDLLGYPQRAARRRDLLTALRSRWLCGFLPLPLGLEIAFLLIEQSQFGARIGQLVEGFGDRDGIACRLSVRDGSLGLLRRALMMLDAVQHRLLVRRNGLARSGLGARPGFVAFSRYGLLAGMGGVPLLFGRALRLARLGERLLRRLLDVGVVTAAGRFARLARQMVGIAGFAHCIVSLSVSGKTPMAKRNSRRTPKDLAVSESRAIGSSMASDESGRHVM